MLVLVTVMSCPCYLNNFPLELTRCCEANFGFETLTKPQGEGSAAWAVALQFPGMGGGWHSVARRRSNLAHITPKRVKQKKKNENI